MISRRGFLGGAVFVGCACCGLRPVLAQSPASSRRQVAVAGRPAKIIDFHAHCVIPEVAGVLKGSKFDRPMPRNQILGSADDRLHALDARGIDTQVLSINQFWWYAADDDLASRIVAVHDEGLAKLCQAHSGRFVALSSPALQNPELAATQLEYAVKSLGLKGASVGGHVNGEVPSSPRFDPFWAKCEQLGVPVFIHPNSAENVIRDKAWDGRGDLGNIIGNPLETTIFLSRLIFDGTLDRFPKLRIVGAHGGGYLPSYLRRTDVACEVRDAANCANKKKPSAYLKDQILADSMVFSAEALRHLVAEMGPGQIVYGSDMPFVWPDTVDDILTSQAIDDASRVDILGGTAGRLLGIA